MDARTRSPAARRLPTRQVRSRGSVGHTRRPLGTGGASRRLLNLDQWAQRRYIGYNSSQIPPIDRPPVGSAALTPLIKDAGTGCPPGQYTVSVIAAETIFTDPFVGDIIPPPAVVAAQGAGVSELQVRVEWGLGAGVNNRLDLDIGAGFELSLVGQVIAVSIILPNGAVDLDSQIGQPIQGTGPLDPVTGLPGAFHNALVYGTVNRQDAYTRQEWQITRALNVPAAATVRVAIPPGVDYVEGLEISTPAGGTAALNFVTGEQQPGVFLDVGQWSVSTTARRFPRVRIPGNARFIESGAPVPGAARLFLLTFTSRP